MTNDHSNPQKATAKVLIKDDDQRKNRGMGNSMIQNAANLGFISNSNRTFILILF